MDALLAAHGGTPGSLLVTDVVLVEAVWTLESAFDQDRRAQLIAVLSLLEERASHSKIAKPWPLRSTCSRPARADSPIA